MKMLTKALLAYCFLLFISTLSFGQVGEFSNPTKLIEEYELKRSLKQNGQQFDFHILPADKRGALTYSKRKYYYWYKAQKVMSTQGGSSGRLLHGKFQSFYGNKQLSQTGSFHKGLKHGEWLYWRADGSLMKSESWQKGVKKGNQRIYDESGNLKELFVVTRRKTKHSFNDTLIVSSNNGQSKTILTFNSEGRKLKEENWKYGVLHGKVKHFENGKLVKTERYKKGELVVKPIKEEKDSASSEISEGKRKKKADKKEQKEGTKKKSDDQDEKVPFFKRIFKKKDKSKKKETPESSENTKPKDKKVKSNKKKKEKKDK